MRTPILSRRTFTAALALNALTAGASSAQAIGPARKVAALNLGALDTLDALGAAVAIVPAPPAGESTARWPRHLLAKYAHERYVKLVSGRAEEGQPNPQVQQLAALKPDLIVSGGRGRGSSTDAFKAIAPVVELSIDNARFVESVARNLVALGTALGQEALGRNHADALRAWVRALHASAAGQGTGLVMFNVGNRVMPQQADARFGMLYELIGIRSVLTPADGAGLSSGRPPANRAAATDDPAAKAAADAEQKTRQAAEAKYLADVMGREPDWLFVVDRNAAFGEPKAAETMAATPVVANSRAWKQKKVVFLDQDGASWYLMAGSLGLLESSLRQVEAAFARHAR
ncbi:ABC transporter substrate-binding protein [Pseudorhodoferax sp.]|uniref:ABC transporter substrate-binding protein n=1 Tax=Pseudorhodoferax sp. TaxID=1993553 RepID=UPI0039E3FFB6